LVEKKKGKFKITKNCGAEGEIGGSVKNNKIIKLGSVSVLQKNFRLLNKPKNN